MIYVDEVRDYGPKGKWSHMWADTNKELYQFATALGLKHSWVHHSRGLSGEFTHFDLRPSKRELALEMGAQFKPLKQFIMERSA